MDQPMHSDSNPKGTLDEVAVELARTRRLVERLETQLYDVRTTLLRDARVKPRFFSIFWPVSFALAIGVPIAWLMILVVILFLFGGVVAVEAVVSWLVQTVMSSGKGP
jgi:hypothetical protein